MTASGVGKANIPVGVGRATPLEGSNAFPDLWRQASDEFWRLAYPQAPPPREPVPAVRLIVDSINQSSQPVMVFVSGTHTNLAEALRLDPAIAEHIRGVFIMGGSIHVAGSIKSDWPEIDNTAAEWNIWVDPLAADEVFASGLWLHLAPLDATDQVLWTEADARQWAASNSPEGNLAGDLLHAMLGMWKVSAGYVWDLVAAVYATDAATCPEVPLSLDVLTEAGPGQGRTVIADQPQNASVCLKPDAEEVRALAAAILGR